ncbi:YncE family protein [Nocardia brasiliensis]
MTEFEEKSVSWVDIASRRVIGSLEVGYYPGQMAVDPKTGTLYVTTQAKDGAPVVVIDTATRTVKKRLVLTEDQLTASPSSIFLDPDNNRLYVALEGRKSILAVVDTVTQRMLSKLPIPDSSGAMAADLNERVLYVSSGDSIAVVDLATNAVTATIPGITDPGVLVLDAAGHRLYVTDAHGNTVSVIDTEARKIVASIDFGQTVEALALDTARHTLYCTAQGVWKEPTDVVTVVDTRTNQISKTISIEGNYLKGLLLDESSGAVYVTVGTRNAVVAIPRLY